MTPAARLSAAIEVLDRILAGQNAELALTNWGRASRFAGSGDRYAVRDLVFAALRCKRSFAAFGGGMTGRGLILGGVRAAGGAVENLFTGEGHAPAPVTAADAGHAPEGAAALDVQDWLLPIFDKALGGEAAATLQAMRQRAPVYLRVNLAKISLGGAQQKLAAEGIGTIAVNNVNSALEVTENARKVQSSHAYEQGFIELQDASSQAVVAALPLQDGMRVLDHCAGGGGKTLAMAARAKLQLFAHDHDPRRMRDVPARAKRAGASVTIVENPEKTAPYDLILTDVPCSGSGSWRRDPQGKWALTTERLASLVETQSAILQRVAPLVRPGGDLAYVTCSVFREENEEQVLRFLDMNCGWQRIDQKRFSPLSGGDGFFLARLQAPN